MSKVRLGKRERAAKKAFNEAISLRNQGFVALNLSLPKPRVEPIAMVATRSGFVARKRDETMTLMANAHTRGIRIGSQLPLPEKPIRGAVKHHPRIGQLGAGNPKR